MEVRITSLQFPETTGEGPQSAATELVFPSDVVRVTAGITGYTAVFENEDDHHLGRLEVEINTSIDPDDATKVTLTGRFGLRDWSNEWDDAYSGLIDVAVLADLETVTPPGPGEARGDLVILGAEITQAIQLFRSAGHLDLPNVFPDNSIQLVAGKPTVVRLYVDYDATSGLTPISTLSGSLTVWNAAGSNTLNPIEPITPRRDSSIDRGSRTHTLNFLIPEAQSLGEVNLLATVFDAFDPTQMSAPLESTVQYLQQPALRVLAVGIEYTGDDVVDDATPEDLAAPSETEFVDTFSFLDLVYPIPEVMITDYRTMEYDEDVESDINEGCDKLGDMKDALADFVGDSDDVVYGLFGPGLNTGSVGGCGGGGVGVGRVFAAGLAAHEIGHALGRKHAPCDNVTRCATPRNADDSYPVYSGYDSDSIGEYGFDPTTTLGTVKRPATYHDFMGYSPNNWISPYTYKALMSAIPGSPVSGGAAIASSTALRRDGEWIPVKQPKLFLRLDIYRDRAVLHPSFHFDARPRINTGRASDYTIEFRDSEGRVLRRECLLIDELGCGCQQPASWPLRVRQAVAFTPAARRLVLYRCDDEIENWEIPRSPEVEVTCQPDDDASVMRLEWNLETQGNGESLWSLVQWQDRAGTWRGLAPRQRQNHLRVPRRIAAMGRETNYRVLVTSGIATGVGYWKGDCDDRAPQPPETPELVLVGTGGGRTSQELERIITVAATGAGDHGGRIRWFVSRGGELARGRRLDLGALKVGFSEVTAQVIGAGIRIPARTWLIERTSDDRFLLHVGTVGGEPSPEEEEPRRDHQHEDDSRHHHHPHNHDKG